MSPPEASAANDISLYYSDKDVCMSLEGIINGNPLPSNVISDVNPYQYHPSALPYGIWFLVESKVKKQSNFGFWRTKGEESQIFSDSLVSGWRRTLEFFEGQAHSGNRTDWVLQEYWITRKISSKDVNEKEVYMLCNVFFVGVQKPNHDKPENIVDFDTVGQPTKSVAQKVSENDTGKGSTSNSQGEINGARSNVTVREIVSDNDVDIVPEVDYLNGGDYLELLDLEIPASPSTSSVSSCVTMSSDECFDALDLLRDLESEKDHDSVQNSAGLKLRVFEPLTPNETVVYTAPSTGTIDKNSSKNERTDLGTEAIASTSQNQAASEKDGKMSRGRKKKNSKKYLCFMPF